MITGDQEAQLSFTAPPRNSRARADLEQPYLVVDIGGGSTEFVLGDERCAPPAPWTSAACG